MAALIRHLGDALNRLSWPRFLLFAVLILTVIAYSTGQITASREPAEPELRTQVTRILAGAKPNSDPQAGQEPMDQKLERARLKVIVAGREIDQASRKLEQALERVEALIEKRAGLAETRKEILQQNEERARAGAPPLPLPGAGTAEDLGQELTRALNSTIADAVDQETSHYRLQVNGLAAGLTASLLLTLAVAKALGGRRRVAERAAENSRLEASCARLAQEATEARLAMLQAQIEPHFLFNTLASVDHLIQTEPAAASRMQKHLIQYLRAAMPQMREFGSTLAREVELARSYLSILQMRMEERLSFDFDIPPELADLPFPPMMLPTLVENAIKHGLEPKPEGGRVEIKAWREGAEIRLSVSDNGVGFSAAPGKGVGLANTRERLALQYGERARLEVVDNAPGARVTLVLPIETKIQPSGAQTCCSPEGGVRDGNETGADCR